jgi:hypothetical protein
VCVLRAQPPANVQTFSLRAGRAAHTSRRACVVRRPSACVAVTRRAAPVFPRQVCVSQCRA